LATTPSGTTTPGAPSTPSAPTPSVASAPTATPTTVAPVPTPAESPTPITDHFELTAADSGRTFAYPLTSRFGIVLDGQTYPRADLQVTCDHAQVLGPISNIPSVSLPDYAVRYEGVNPGTCSITDRAFSVTILITSPTPTEVTPTSVTPSPAPTQTAPGSGIGGAPPYLDDRNDGADVIRSYYNAIDRREYDRAYSYWEPGAAASHLPPYAQFKAGYADTQSVRLDIGPVWAQGAAGSAYQSIAVALTAKLTNGTSRNYAGCYVLRLGNPHIQDNPPYHPWAIQSATIQNAASAADATGRLSSICNQNGSPPGILASPTPTPNPTDISPDRYLDDRSTPEEVLRSLFNAINSREYDRAYSYWDLQAPNTGLPSYAQFKAGYANTASVDLTIGQVAGGVAAGNLYFQVPTTLVAHTTEGQTQTFVGCYTLHLGQPAVQDLPPFQPMAIQSANVRPVPNDANASVLMAQACH
jgi:hypothetical protein